MAPAFCQAHFSALCFMGCCNEGSRTMRCRRLAKTLAPERRRCRTDPNDERLLWARRAAIEAVGAGLRFLPPYSPDFNPIEQAFAKLKAFLRAARPRTFDQVCDLIALALTLFTSEECANYIRHCGYRVATSL